MKHTLPENLDHSYFMNIALEKAKDSGVDIPVAALIVYKGKVLAISSNQKEQLNDPTAHAEMIVIKEACKKLGRWRLTDVAIYTTLEPCPMCATAILYSRIPLVVFAAYDTLYGAMGTVLDLTKLYSFYKPTVIGGIQENQSRILLQGFFQ